MTCRCPICHRADAHSNRQRKSYVIMGISGDENMYSSFTKKQSHKLRRVRETRLWVREAETD